MLVVALWSLTFAMSAADAADMPLQSFHLPSFAQLRSWFSEPSWGSLPRQATGTAAGHGHTASAASTRAGRGAGHPPGQGRGQLARYAPLKYLVKQGPSGHGQAGFAAATSKRVAAKSTANSDYYQNADGSYTRRITEYPVNYRDPSGNWQPINTSVVKGAGGQWQEAANSLAVNFAPSADDPALVHVSLDSSHGLTYGLAGAAAVAPTVSGSTAIYPNVLPSTDLVLQPTAVGTEESLILHSASAPASWTFPLALTGLTAVPAQDGSIDLVNASAPP